MRQISYWAASYKWAARILIIGCYIILNALVFIIADIANDENFVFPRYALIATLVVFFASFLLYPVKSQRLYKNYTFRKTCDVVLVCCSLLLAFFSFTGKPGIPTQSTYASAIVSASDGSGIDKPAKKKKNKEQLKKLKALYKELKKELRSEASAGQVFLIILTVLVGIGLIFLLAAASCSVMCAGNEGLGWALLILGTAGIIFLMVRVIRGIKRKYRKQADIPEGK